MIADLYTELVAYLTEKLPGVAVEELTPEFQTRKKVSFPSCLVELSEIAPDFEFGNQREICKVNLNFQARIIVDPNRRRSSVELQELALLAFWAIRNWVPQTENVGPTTMKPAAEDAFKPTLAGFYTWLIEWEHEVWLNFADAEVLTLIKKITATDNFENTTEVE